MFNGGGEIYCILLSCTGVSKLKVTANVEAPAYAMVMLGWNGRRGLVLCRVLNRRRDFAIESGTWSSARDGIRKSTGCCHVSCTARTRRSTAGQRIAQCIIVQFVHWIIFHWQGGCDYLIMIFIEWIDKQRRRGKFLSHVYCTSSGALVVITNPGTCWSATYLRATVRHVFVWIFCGHPGSIDFSF